LDVLIFIRRLSLCARYLIYSITGCYRYAGRRQTGTGRRRRSARHKRAIERLSLSYLCKIRCIRSRASFARNSWEIRMRRASLAFSTGLDDSSGGTIWDIYPTRRFFLGLVSRLTNKCRARLGHMVKGGEEGTKMQMWSMFSGLLFLFFLVAPPLVQVHFGRLAIEL